MLHSLQPNVVTHMKVNIANYMTDLSQQYRKLSTINDAGERIAEFQVRTQKDAHVLLSPCDGCDGYEVVIGGWDNSQSVLRCAKQMSHFASAQVKLFWSFDEI